MLYLQIPSFLDKICFSSAIPEHFPPRQRYRWQIVSDKHSIYLLFVVFCFDSCFITIIYARVRNVVSQRLRSIINTDPSITALSITGKCIEDLEKKYVEYDWDNMSMIQSQEACISSDMYWEREEFERLGLSIAMLPSLKHLIVDEADVCYSNTEAICSKIAQSTTIQIVTFLNVSFCWDTWI